jgi:chromosome segregation ATPase
MNTIKAQSSLDTKQLKIENEQLLQQIASLKDNTGIGKVHKEVDILNQRLYEAKKRNDDLESNLHEVTQQRDTLLEQLLDYEENIDQKIIDKKTYEETKTKTLEATIDNLKNQLKSDHDYYQALEKEKLNLTQEIDDLTNWKAIYEAGHGLQQLSRNQKKLTDDNRRLIQALEQRTSQIDILMDANNILSLAFEKLKKETGKPANFRYPELELREEVQSTIFTLSFQLQKLEDEVNTLESENTKLRKTLRENLSTTFADKIKDGKLEIPFDDRSRQLAQENKQLKADLQILNNQLLKYESLHQKKKRKVKLPKEKSSTTDVNHITETQQKKSTEPSTQEKDLGHGTIRRPSMDSRQDHEEEGDENYDELDYYHSTDTGGILNDAFGSDIKTLLSENTLLHKKITDLQLQLDILIKQQNLSGYVKVEDLAAIVSQNNELILKELEEVRKSASNLQPQLLLSDRSNETTSLPPMARPRSARINEQSTSRLPTGKKLSVELATPSKDQKSIAGTPFWTPNMARGGMPFPSPMQNPVHAGTPSGPNTPYGKQLLNSTLYHMNLPPEEWAGEVKDLTFHLMESLEQLYEREQDLEVQKSLVKKFEENLVEIKLQMTLLYHEFANSKDTWSKKEKEILGENKVLLNERDDLKLKLKRTQDILNLLQKNETNKDSLELKLIELTRKITIYEVNENILSRKYISLNEILEVETKRRLELQNDFIEMESLLKQRILYLEQYKIRSSSRLSFVQMKLDSCVPQDDYLAVQLELENLREDHLNTLRREIETRVNILKILHKEKEYNQMKLVFQQRSIEVEKLNNQVLSLEKELIHQKELTNRALVSANSTVEISNLVSEMARYRGEVSRLEVELLSSNQKLELLTTNINDCLGENDKLMNRVKELEKRESEYLDKESSARKELLQMKLNYEKGLTREEKEKLQHDLLELRKQLEEKSADSLKYKELLDISQNQLTVMQEFKASFENELKELREYCNKLESRSEDEILIGRLQRQLISTKASYKSFVRKYHSLRENIRKREIAMRILENSLTEKEKEFFLEKERSLLTINSLRKAIKNIKETIVQSTPNLMETTINTGLEKKGSDNANGGQKLIQVRANNAWGKNKYYTLGLGEKLVEISEKVETLAELAENSVQKAMAKDEETRNLQNNVEDLELERAILTQRLRDLEVFAASNSANVQNPSSKQSHQQQVANRLIALSEEIRITKLSNLQQRRTIQMMREEIKHLKNVISKMELDVNELEKGKIELEVSKSIFFDHPIKKGKKRNTSLESALDENESDLIDDNSLEAEIEELLNFKTLKNDKSARNLMDSQLKRSLSKLSIDIEDPEQKEENEEMDRKLQLLNDQLFSSKKENSELQLKNNSLSGKIDDMSHLLNEKEQQLNFYERVLHEHGLQNILLRNRGNSMGSSHPGHHSNHRDYQIMPEEQEKLQEAASATIGSLKSIIEEKNHIIDKLREKVDELTAQAIPNSKSRTDKRVDDILDEIANDEAERRFTARGTGSPIKGHTPAHVGALGMNLEHLQKLQDQLAAADEIIKEKDDTVQQLESRLAMETNSRERAENRCGEALKEIEAMKEDMMTLYNQLQDQNQRNAHLAPSLLPKPTSPPRSPERKTQNDNYDFKESMEVEEVRSTNMKLLKKNKDMEKLIKQKDEKMKNYREIIIKLKEEFIKMEEERVTDDIFSNRKDKSGGDSDDERGRIISQNELKELKDKISDLHAGLKNAKTDLEKAKKQREKLHHEKQLATEEIIKLNDELGKKEQQLVYATNMTNKFKRDLEDAKRKEVRMKEKMKEMAQNNSNVKKDSENETGGHGIAVPKNLKDAYFKAKDHIQHLENENELLRAQIAAFGKGNKMESLQKEFREYSSRPLEEGKEELHPNRTQSGGYILGNGASNAADEWKQQSQQRWELEKKLQKRVGQLEKKLSEVTNENDELKGQLLKTKDNLQHATSAKDEISKKMQNANKQVHETKKLTMQEISELDQVLFICIFFEFFSPNT